MINIAIDGPSGAGKSSLAKKAAKLLDCNYVDTGALYRAIGLFVFRNGIEIGDIPGVLSVLDRVLPELRYENGVQHVFLEDEDVSEEIRMPNMSMYASFVSSIPEVREKLLDVQRITAANNNVIMDGRDIGTVILPDAQLKVFLTATPEERAMRRTNELIEKGQAANYEQVLADIKERDERDSSRAIAPLKPADDAIMFNNTGFTPAQSLEKLLGIVADKLGITEAQYEK